MLTRKHGVRHLCDRENIHVRVKELQKGFAHAATKNVLRRCAFAILSIFTLCFAIIASIIFFISQPTYQPSPRNWYKINTHFHDVGSTMVTIPYTGQWCKDNQDYDALLSAGGHYEDSLLGGIANPSFETNDTWSGLGYDYKDRDNVNWNCSGGIATQHQEGSASLYTYLNTSSLVSEALVSQFATLFFLKDYSILEFSIYPVQLRNDYRSRFVVWIRARGSDDVMRDIRVECRGDGSVGSNSTTCLYFNMSGLHFNQWNHYSFNLTKAIENTWASPSSPHHVTMNGYSVNSPLDFKAYAIEKLGAFSTSVENAVMKAYWDGFYPRKPATEDEATEVWRAYRNRESESPIPYEIGEEMSDGCTVVHGLETWYNFTEHGFNNTKLRNSPYNVDLIVMDEVAEDTDVYGLWQGGYDAQGLSYPSSSRTKSVMDKTLTLHPSCRMTFLLDTDYEGFQDSFGNSTRPRGGNVYSMVYANSNSIADVKQAIKDRRLYGVFGKYTHDHSKPIIISFTAYDSSYLGMIGDEITPTSAPTFHINITSTTEIDKVWLIGNNETIKTWSVSGTSLSTNYTMEIDHWLTPIKNSSYSYVRLQMNCTNGNWAFTNPIWITPEVPDTITTTSDQTRASWTSKHAMIEMHSPSKTEKRNKKILQNSMKKTKIKANQLEKHSYLDLLLRKGYC